MRVLYLHGKHTPQIVSFMNNDLNQYMNLYKSIEIILKENNKRQASSKTLPSYFSIKKHKSVSSFCQCGTKVIFNDSQPFNFGRYTSVVNLVPRIKQVIELFHSYQIVLCMCFLWRYSTRLLYFIL